jgi:hypothetical protein
MRRVFRIGIVAMAGLLAASLASRAQAGGGDAGQPRQRGFGGQGAGQMVQGTVTAATTDKVTIKTEAGDSYDVMASASARIMKDRAAIKLTDVKPGDMVMAMGAVDATKKTVQAVMVNDIDAATVQKAKDDLGKTYLTGKVTTIDLDNAKVTVLRTDGVSQAMTLDEGTSIQRGMRGIQVGLQGAGGMGGGGRQGGGGAAAGPAQESITLADVKVGDTIAATGGLKNGVFVPAKLGVGDGAAAGGGRRRGGAGAGSGDPQTSPPATP